MRKLLFVLLIICLFLPGIAIADGTIVPPPNYAVWETSQRGVIFYESSIKTETLVLSMSFQGEATDFAWIIPTPNKPEVERGSKDLFTELEKIIGTSAVTYKPKSNLSNIGQAESKTAVTVVEEKTVDYYDVAVLSSTNAAALATWLNDNGYEYPEKYAYVFNDYINNNWYFVAAKIIPEAVDEITTEIKSGIATPLQLTFTTENIVYPLKISKVAGEQVNKEYIPGYEPVDYVDIYLYVITDHQQELTNFTVEYAGKIKDEEVKDLAVDIQGNAWVTPQKSNYYLTKLYSYYAVANMDNDLFPKDAEKDTKVRSGYQWTSKDTTKIILYTLLAVVVGIVIFVMSPFVLLFILYSLIFYLVKNRKVKIIFVVLQVIDTVINLCILSAAIVLTVFASMELFEALDIYTYSVDEEITLTAGSIALAVVLVLIFIAKVIALIIQKKKYKK